jgi:hypothetical protein
MMAQTGHYAITKISVGALPENMPYRLRESWQADALHSHQELFAQQKRVAGLAKTNDGAIL